MRNKKISADITPDAKKMLDDACIKHDRSKGFLLEKMIRKFCADSPVEEKPKSPTKKPVKRFIPPTVEEVFNYCNERCNNVDAQNFVDHYTSNGWLVGKNKVKDWKACVRTWEKNSKSNNSGVSKITQKNMNNLEGGW